MVDLIGHAIAEADGSDFQADPVRYRRLAVAALKPLANPTDAMIAAAHEAVWFDALLGHQQPQRFPAGSEGDDSSGVAQRTRRAGQIIELAAQRLGFPPSQSVVVTGAKGISLTPL
jgi:hypothetical protein